MRSVRFAAAVVLGLAGTTGFAWWAIRPARERADPATTDGRDAPGRASGPGLAGRPRDASAPHAPAAGTATVVGRVWRDGKPAAARVLVRGAPEPAAGAQEPKPYGPLAPAPPVVATAQADATGSFAVGGLAPGRYVLDATAADDARGRAVAMATEGVEPDEASIDLHAPAHALRGRVETSKGRPWRGTVRVVTDAAGAPPFDAANRGVVATTTDEAGRFAVTGLAGARVAVHAVAEGAWVAAGPSARLPYGGDYRLVVPDEEEWISGVVVDDATGAPVRGATVEQDEDGSGSAARATTDESGRFRIPVLNAQFLVARAEGYFPRYEPFWGGSARIPLRRAAAARGRVTAVDDGRPMGGLTVWVQQGQGAPDRDATTDAEGRYEVPGLWPGEAAFYAFGRGWVPQGLEEVAATGWNPLAVMLEPGATAQVDLVVARGARATGRVLGPDGAPVPGSRVSAYPWQPGSGARGPAGALLHSTTSACGSDGAYAVEDLVGGVEYRFFAQAPGFPSVEFGTAIADPGAALRLDARLPAAGWIVVRVRERGTGEPLARVAVVVYADAAGAPLSGFHARTGYDGAARAGPLLVGEWEVTAWLANAEEVRTRTTLRVTEAEPAPAVVLEAEAGGVGGPSIEGRVVLPDGAPAGQATVDRMYAGSHRATEVADGDGRFAFDGVVGDDEHRLVASATVGPRRYAGEATASPGSKDVVIALREAPDERQEVPPPLRPARVATVLDAEGRPVPRAMLVLRATDSEAWRIHSWVEDGRVGLGVTHEAFVVEVKDPRSAAGAPWPAGVGWGRIEPGTSSVEIRLPPEAPVEGRVLDPAGQPVLGAEVRAIPSRVPVPAGGCRAEEIVARARTDARGAFFLRGLGPESYRLELSPPPRMAFRGPAEVRGGATGVEIRLAHGAAPTVTVVGPDGRPVAEALVSVTVGPHPPYLEDPDSFGTRRALESGAACTGPSGTARLTSLDPSAAYDLFVSAPPGNRDLVGVGVPAWRAADTTVRLPRACTVAGSVRSASGAAVRGGKVRVVDALGKAHETRTSEDGSFAVDRVPAGGCQVTVEGRVDGKDARGSAEVEAEQAEDLVLVVR